MDRLDQLLKLHAAEPDDPFCTYGIALEHAKAGRADEAIAWLERTLSIDGAYCYAYFQKGRLEAERGDAAAARRTLEAGLDAAARAGDAHASDEIRQLLESLR